MYALCDIKGSQYLLLEGIVDHWKDKSTLNRADMYIQHGGLVLSSVANLVYLCGEDVGSNPAWTVSCR
jgi:hypothetical protein